jgi:hypothetical protein
MSAGFPPVRPDAAVWAAQLALAHLADRVAGSGYGAMRDCPALLADVDQHAAAVRDALVRVSGRVSAVGLAGYADGLSDTAARHGWQLPTASHRLDWSAPAWHLVRLLAVCALAESVQR